MGGSNTHERTSPIGYLCRCPRSLALILAVGAYSQEIGDKSQKQFDLAQRFSDKAGQPYGSNLRRISNDR